MVAVATAIGIPAVLINTVGDAPYHPPADGSGYSLAPTDQPMPVPLMESPRPCDWLTAVMPQLQQTLGATGHSGEHGGAGCHVSLPGGEDIQIGANGPYAAETDPKTFVRPVTLDGLTGRQYAHVTQGAGECSANVDVRSLAQLELAAWYPGDPAKDHDQSQRDARCQQLMQVADIVIHHFVPIAGGTPAPDIEQQPSADEIAGAQPCKIGAGPVIYADGLDDENPMPGSGPLGTTCQFRGQPGTVTVLLTPSPVPLTAFPPQLPGAQTTQGKLGVLPARTEHKGNACDVAVGLSTGQVLSFQYQTGIAHRSTVCQATTSMAAAALDDLITSKS